MTNLKPCPFCGGESGFNIDDGITMSGHVTGTAECLSGCGCKPSESHWAKAKKELKEKIASTWNTRPTEDTLQARIDELEAANDLLQGWMHEVKAENATLTAQVKELREVCLQSIGEIILLSDENNSHIADIKSALASTGEAE